MVNAVNLPEPALRADRHAEDGPSQPCLQQQTPPTSDIGSPDTKADASNVDSQDAPGVQRLPNRVTTPSNGASMKLPSLEAFDRGVEALARLEGRRNQRSSNILLPSPIPLRAHNDGRSSRDLLDDSSNIERSASPPEATTGLDISYFSPSHAFPASHGRYPYHAVGSHPVPHQSRPTSSCLRSPSPDDNHSHNKQQYTTEEGDFIIYARYDRNLKWSHVEQEFAAQFGHSPKRTVQGIQAWHYRMNNHIPDWDENGYLVFDSEDGEKPCQVSAKSHRKHLGKSGIALRYPERAVNYTWVDNETKLQARDWATKRTNQLQERRRRKQERRALAAQ
ncbi:hypothetical protein F53441_1855 [Fusarium austroafricanum]|uniref:Uncharacterized protein n=1 Tax=Fusarium austroafricanum TaxID=2364996 RepID=A0A8H4KRF7_9HYPO|nr:hypothetical protein F53441_1855 [Fusarium austroafricanum]